MQGGSSKKKTQKSKKRAGSHSLEIVFDLAELSHLHTVSRSREVSRFLEFTQPNHCSPDVVITGNYNPHDHCLEETIHILTD